MQKSIVLVLILAVAVWTQGGEQKPAPQSPEELKTRFVECHNAKDVEGFLALFCTDETPEAMQPAARRTKIFTEHAPYAIASAEVVDLTETDRERFARGVPYKGGVLYWANLQPIKKLVVKYQDPAGVRTVEEMIGQRGTDYLFCNPAVRKQ